jgi:uncharacterized protein YjbI with pentapeptide repeats
MVKPATITVRDRELETCHHGECEDPCIWDYPTCWKHLKEPEREGIRARLSDALRLNESLSRLVLTGADLSGFDFTGADLSSAHLNSCNLRNAVFIDANLRRAFVSGSDFSDADLSRAELDQCVFTSANLENVTLLAYSLSFGRVPINIYSRHFGSAKLWGRPHINEDVPWTAEPAYRALKRYFIDQADYESASWASYSEKLMERKSLWKQSKRRWMVSLVLAASCGYGEKPGRVIVSAFAAVIIYASLFGLLRCVTQGGAQLGLAQNLYFSFATLFGYSFPDLLPSTNTTARFLVTSEAGVGILILGLFVFTLTKRFVAR